MSWQQLTLQIKAHASELAIEALEEQLTQFGALSLSYLDSADQPLFQREPGATELWQNTAMQCLFPSSMPLAAVLAWLQQQEILEKSFSPTVEVLADQDWERSWMEGFEAMQYGERLWICPSWQTPPDSSALNIMLDPGLAFGSGTHATTALCLRWLEQQAELLSKPDLAVIDYGCGSGVLALAAALLGCKSIDAVDHDPQAVEATMENCRRNAISDKQIRTWLDTEFPATRVDILLANILAEPLKQLAPLFAQSVKPGGQIVLSGILANQAEEVRSSYSQWFDLSLTQQLDEWMLLAGSRLKS